tara:strand:+ start:309 stop:677 length:369 start_codon:yes stop_codon:yes gene_type:complete
VLEMLSALFITLFCVMSGAIWLFMVYRNSRLRLKGEILFIALLSWLSSVLLLLSVFGLSFIIIHIWPDLSHLWERLEFVVIFLFVSILLSSLIFILFSFRVEWFSKYLFASFSPRDEIDHMK